jgi:glycosyltransferase involved in cell wall biosynthesis
MAVSDAVLFPSQAMLDLAASHMGGRRPGFRVTHYGTRHDLFHPPDAPRNLGEGPARLLNVSLYCDQKNLGTLLSAVRSLDRESPGAYRLDLTAGFERDWVVDSADCPAYESDATLYHELRARGVARDTNWTSYSSLPDLYRSADIFVFPSYTESFGHPLIEAMASGLPIVASDIAVNRELCAGAAVYFPVFDAGACAEAIRRVRNDESLRQRLGAEGLRRAGDFTWQTHVAKLVEAFRGAS